MKWSVLVALLASIIPFGGIAQAPLPTVIKGRVVRLEHFLSQHVTPRNIDIWLPEGYSISQKYSVLYMHDGQMLYDSSITWNKQAWEVDDVASELLASGAVKPFIVVGIWNGGATRHPDYFPQKPFELLAPAQKDTVTAQLQRAGRSGETFAPQSDQYLKFIVEELKPYIDNHYSVHTHRDNTFIAGSSMGGLISIYALCEYHHIFGGAACLSTHWVGTFGITNNPIPNAFISYLSQNLPNPATHRIYFDTGDQTLDALYPPIQQRVDSLMATNGFDSNSWVTKYFPGEDHSERAWAKRLAIPLRFLLNK